jgi:signal transduction histidine kinase
VRRLSEKIGRELIAIFAIAISLFAITSFFLCKDIELDRNKELLKTTLNAIRTPLKNSENFQKFCESFSENTRMRMTIIDIDGTVLADSEVNAIEMDNHAMRKEIFEASINEYGYAIRKSATINSDLLYAATKIVIEDKEYFVRINSELSDIMNSFYLIWASVLIIFLIMLIILVFKFNKFNQKIRNEIVKIYSAFSSLEKKEYNLDLGSSFAKEFYEIGLYLKKFAKKLQKRDKQKRKYAAKLKLLGLQKNAIISAISHEFKNPIAAVIGYAQTLNENDDLDPVIKKNFCEKIMKNSHKISDTIDRLALSIKLETNEIAPRKSDFDLDILTKEIIANFAAANQKREIIYSGESAIINADRDMFYSVVNNLIENAIKYSESSIKVSIKNREFKVIDRGIGIAPEDIDKITQKFYRADAKSWNNSLGLGLSFVSDILRLHDLKLEIKSELHKGSEFSFAF